MDMAECYRTLLNVQIEWQKKILKKGHQMMNWPIIRIQTLLINEIYTKLTIPSYCACYCTYSSVAKILNNKQFFLSTDPKALHDAQWGKHCLFHMEVQQSLERPTLPIFTAPISSFSWDSEWGWQNVISPRHYTVYTEILRKWLELTELTARKKTL